MNYNIYSRVIFTRIDSKRIRGISALAFSERGVSRDKSTRRFRYASSRTCVRGKIHRCRNSKEEREDEVGVRA